ncbi:MAG: LptE family protein [Candidatus Zixiibacteriota bacterium]
MRRCAFPIFTRTTTAVAAFICLLALAACSPYSFNPGGKSSIKSIAIERFDNKTPEFALSDRMTDIVIDAFIANGTIKVVSRENADAYLTGVLTRYERRPFEYDQNDQVTRYAVQMDFDIALHDTKTDTEMWKESIRQSGQYDPVSETEETGQQKALALLVTAVINRTTKAW